MTIVFIDDDEEDLEIYQEAIRFLNASEYLSSSNEKLICKTYHKCTAFLSDTKLLNKPDLIFLDINMPQIGGRDCLVRIRQEPKCSDVPIVMLSTACTTRETLEYRSIGAHDCIQKPGDFKDLVKIFARFIFERFL